VRYVERLATIVRDELREWTDDELEVAAALIDLKMDLRQEIRLAAMTWLAEQGNFEYVVDFLTNADNRSNWRTFIQALRHTLFDRPELASALFDGLRHAGGSQSILYELIVGKSSADLEAGADAHLVEWLDHRDLAVRVLAIENLREITGGVTFGYLPTKSEQERKRIINGQWKKQLENQAIRYETPPAVPLVTFDTNGLPPLPGPEGGESPADGGR
jgi:hypothetical protein